MQNIRTCEICGFILRIYCIIQHRLSCFFRSVSCLLIKPLFAVIGICITFLDDFTRLLYFINCAFAFYCCILFRCRELHSDMCIHLSDVLIIVLYCVVLYYFLSILKTELSTY